MTYEREMKAIKLVQERGEAIGNAHTGIAADLEELKRQLLQMDGAAGAMQDEKFAHRKAQILETMTGGGELPRAELAVIYAEAEACYIEPVGLADILSVEDFVEAERRVDQHVLDFNRRYGLDGWDYAIAGSCGLFAAMLDLLCVRAPPRPSTTKWTTPVDGIFNRAVQAGFNKLIPPS